MRTGRTSLGIVCALALGVAGCGGTASGSYDTGRMAAGIKSGLQRELRQHMAEAGDPAHVDVLRVSCLHVTKIRASCVARIRLRAPGFHQEVRDVPITVTVNSGATQYIYRWPDLNSYFD